MLFVIVVQIAVLCTAGMGQCMQQVEYGQLDAAMRLSAERHMQVENEVTIHQSKLIGFRCMENGNYSVRNIGEFNLRPTLHATNQHPHVLGPGALRGRPWRAFALHTHTHR